jgi:hypothetical protein
MKFLRRSLSIAFILILFIAAWLWFNQPRKIDMATYAPADALVYLESNSLVDIGQAILGTDAWRVLSPYVGKADFGWLQRRWLPDFTAYTGIGSAANVILARAQVAVVMLDLGTTEQGETLTIKPETAILIETHTSERRTRPAIEQVLQHFAKQAYKQPVFRIEDIDGARLMVWIAPAGGRQIVALVDGSLAIIGNSERAVRTCLEVRRSQRASLRANPELQQMRAKLMAERALAFGFVSSSNAARLFSMASPLLFGNAPGGFRFDPILANGASKILAGVGWSSHVHNGRIEDRYLLSLQPTMISRLRPQFGATMVESQVWKVLPTDIESLTIYKFEEPAKLWKAFESAVSSQLDTLSAVVFSSLLKAAISTYGIEDPEKFLELVGPELATVRRNQSSGQSILIAQVRDEKALRKVLSSSKGQDLGNELVNSEVVETADRRLAFSFTSNYLVLGMPNDVRSCIQAANDQNQSSKEQWIKKLTRFIPRSISAGSITYANESERVRMFLSAIAQLLDSQPVSATPQLERTIAELPYSATETTLGDQGLERTTRSSFGQFSTLIGLLAPDH